MKKMLFIFVGAAVWCGVGLFYVTRRVKKQVLPICGWLDRINIVAPNYKDTTRIGTRIDFSFRMCGSGHEDVRLRSVNLFVLVEGVLHKRHIEINHAATANRQGLNHCYLDDIDPKLVDAESIYAEAIDTENRRYTFYKKPGTK
jgi:hypothetical protein